MSKITLRDAKRSDAADLAILDNLAGHNIPIVFWLEQTTNNRIEDAIAYGRDRLADESGFYNWKKARVAVEDELIVGMATCYEMPQPGEDSQEAKRQSEAFIPVYELHDICVGHWFIDALAVYPTGQKKGVGKLLFEDCIDRGKKASVEKMSLIVEDTNKVAYELYRSYGFEQSAVRDFVPFEGALEINQWILMSKSLA